MVEIDELFGFGDVADNVELADGFQFRGFAGQSGSRVGFAFRGNFAPQTFAGEELQRFCVFDDDIHRRTV